MSKKIKWLHISDIHYSFENYSTNKMRSKLIEYIKSYVKENEKFDFIVITGDVAYKGSTYDAKVKGFIKELIESSGIDKENIFIVPGNHDLKRTQKRERLIGSIVDGKDPLKEIENLDKDTYKDLLQGQRSFWTFHKYITTNEYNKNNLHFIDNRDSFNIINLNTTLLCGRNGEEGHISINLKKLLDVLDGTLSDEKINIAIGHHNIDCFFDAEKNKILNTLYDSGVDLYLCGHSHKPNYSIDNNNEQEFYIIMSGAGVIDGYANATFIIGSINDNKEGTIEYYSWDNEDEVWSIETKGLGRRVKNGKANFELKKKDFEDIFIEEDDFKDFIVDFHNNISDVKLKKDIFIEEDIEKKFKNMRCNSTVQKQFKDYSRYFPIIDDIMNDSACLGLDKKLVIPSVIYEEYNNTLDKHSTGGEILEAIVSNVYFRYKTKIKYPELRLKFYIKILVFWLINGCDIFDDVKEQ